MTADFDNPSSWLKTFTLQRDVVSCQEAAEAKGIPLERELKSLILKVDDDLAIVHIRGDRRLSLRRVKKALHAAEARLADPSALACLDVVPGTVAPFGKALWDLPHLISDRVLELTWVSTNSGSSNGYVIFDPVVLLRARQAIPGSFEEQGQAGGA